MSVINLNKYIPKAPIPKKFIIVPKYAKLYAMGKICGPTQAPIKTPIAVPIDIIGELLSQKAFIPEIFEVVPIPPGHNNFTKPVQLTLDNYRMSYKEILEGSNFVVTPGPVNIPEPVVEPPVIKEGPKDEPVKVDTPVITNTEVVEPVVISNEVEETQTVAISNETDTDTSIEEIEAVVEEESSVDTATDSLTIDSTENNLPDVNIFEYDVIAKDEPVVEDKPQPQQNQNYRNKKRRK